MIKNSIELAQILSSVCLEPYPSIYYKIAQELYTCFKAENFVYIYAGPQRQGIAQDFETKLCNSRLNAKQKPNIAFSDNVLYIEQNLHEGDIILLLDENKDLLEFEPNTIAIYEGEPKAKFNYIIPTKNANRASEIQKLLLNSLAEELLKFLA